MLTIYTVPMNIIRENSAAVLVDQLRGPKSFSQASAPLTDLLLDSGLL